MARSKKTALTADEQKYWDRLVLAIKADSRVVVSSEGRKNAVLAADRILRKIKEIPSDN